MSDVFEVTKAMEALIAVCHIQVIHVLQPICGINKPKKVVTPASVKVKTMTHELDAVNPIMLLQVHNASIQIPL